MRVLGLCGSLRQRSLSAALLQAFSALAPEGMAIHAFDRRGELPLFSPDAELDPPPVVREFWRATAQCDALLIVSPEYAHGITAVMKNQLDWLVGQVPMAGKPVAVINPAYASHHADAALREVVRTMSMTLIDDACRRIPVIGSGFEREAIARGDVFRDEIAGVFDALAAHARNG